MTVTGDIAVTGVGAWTPVGADAATTWEAVLARRSGVRLLEESWAADLPVRLAAPAAVDPATVLDRIEMRRTDRAQQFALLAAREAWADAGTPNVDPTRLAVVIGSGIGGISTLVTNLEILATQGARYVSPLAVPMLMANGAAAAVGLELGARGGVHTPVSACASGAEAITLAVDLLRRDRVDLVVCGGTEAAIVPLCLAAFAAMRALSRWEGDPAEASRPFDTRRDGFVLGEGAGVLVLERAADARARGARVQARIGGYGIASDAHHVAQPDPEGNGAAAAVEQALRDSDLAPTDVGHVNAHATSTPAGDVAEAVALRRVFGAATSDIAVSATKSATGHLLGAAGAVETILTVRAVANLLAPPVGNLDQLDPKVDLDVVSGVPRPLRSGSAALCTSFGFGGHDVAVSVLPA